MSIEINILADKKFKVTAIKSIVIIWEKSQLLSLFFIVFFLQDFIYLIGERG